MGEKLFELFCIKNDLVNILENDVIYLNILFHTLL